MDVDDVSKSELEMVPFESQQRPLNTVDISENNGVNETYITSTSYTVNTAFPSADLNNKENINDPHEIEIEIEEDITDTNTHQTQNESENCAKEETVNQKPVNLGFIQMVMSSLFYFSDNLAINLAILIAITINLLDGFGDVGLSFSLFWNGDIEGGTILLSIDYLAIVLTVIHFSTTSATINISSIAKICECSLLIILHPIAPSITMIFWLLARYKPTKNLEDHFHFLSKLVLTITATFEAPLQVIATTCLGLTGRIQTPWSNEKQLCDALGNCLPMGYFTIFVYCLSWLSLVKTSIAAFQVGNKVTLVVFLLTTIVFRLSCFIGLATYSTFWSLLILIPLVFTNLLIVTRCSNKTHTGIHILTSVFCSIFVTTVIPEDPSKKERTGDSDINQDLAVYMATLLSLSNILIIFFGTLIVFLFVQFSPGFVVDPCIELDTYQLRFLFFCFSIPLFILSMMVTFWFYITQTETNQTVKLSQQKYRILKTKIHDYRYVEISANIFLFICLFAIIILNVLLCEKQDLQEKNNCFPRKQSNSSAPGAILVSGGFRAHPGDVLSTLELFVPSTGITKVCNNMTLSNPIRSHTINNIDNKPVICGGLYSNTATCIIFKDGKWEEYSKLAPGREGQSSWLASNNDIVLLGGDIGNAKSTSIVPNGGGQSVEGFDLKDDAASSCAINDGDSTILTGGRSPSSKVVVRYNLMGFVEYLPELNLGRHRHGCGSYRQSDGSLTLVVAGGAGTSTETLVVLPGNKWTDAAPLPRTLIGDSFASLSNKFYIMGGFPGPRTEILEFDGDEWKKVGDLTEIRNLGASTAVNVEKIEFCK